MFLNLIYDFTVSLELIYLRIEPRKDPIISLVNIVSVYSSSETKSSKLYPFASRNISEYLSFLYLLLCAKSL